jgi:cell division septum initiation protein DivIVA
MNSNVDPRDLGEPEDDTRNPYIEILEAWGKTQIELLQLLDKATDDLLELQESMKQAEIKAKELEEQINSLNKPYEPSN